MLISFLQTVLDNKKRERDPIRYWRNRGAVIGEGCEIYPSASFSSEPYLIHLGNHVRVGNNVTFVTHDGGVWVLRGRNEECKDIDLFPGITEVGDNVHIGTGAIIMGGIKIGSHSIIGCGAVVTKDVPPNSVVVGVPARALETIDEYFEKHRHEFVQTKHMTPEEKREFLLDKFGQ